MIRVCWRSLPLVVPCLFNYVFVLPLLIFFVELIRLNRAGRVEFKEWLSLYFIFVLALLLIWVRTLVRLSIVSLSYVFAVFIVAIAYTSYTIVTCLGLKDAQKERVFCRSFVNLVSVPIIILFLVVYATLVQESILLSNFLIFILSMIPLIFLVAAINNSILQIYHTGYNLFTFSLSYLWFFDIALIEMFLLVDTGGQIRTFVSLFLIWSFALALASLVAGYVLFRVFRMCKNRGFFLLVTQFFCEYH
jgi:hypothetical protein